MAKNNFDENSIIIETFTYKHGKYTGIVYGGSSRKQKKNFQIGNKILLNWKSKGENKIGYFNIELIKPISPLYFHDKIKSISILSASSILKILLPERQINKKIYNSFEKLLDKLNNQNWMKIYVLWEMYIIKELGFEVNNDKIKSNENFNIKEALTFNKKVLLENFIIPNKIKLPISRNILEKYCIN